MGFSGRSLKLRLSACRYVNLNESLFVLLMLGVGIVFLALTLLAADPDCKEGPCADDFVVFLGFMVEAVIAVHWVVFAIAVSWTSSKGSRNDDGR